MTIEQLVI